MSWYYDFEPQKPIETDKGIKARSKRGDFVKNWWASRWLAAMERVMDRGRLQRGRSYARKGQVLSLTEAAGQITAQVQGSRRTPYKVQITLKPLPETSWQTVLAALAERPYFVAQLLAGEMPQEIEEAFHAVRLDLFPGRAELKQDCNCPDWADVCKHLAAVHYILAERFDEDPFLLFRLRGKSQADILAALGTASSVAGEEAVPEYQAAPSLTVDLTNFWQPGPELADFAVTITGPTSPYPILTRLGEPDFLPEQRWLKANYDRVTELALDLVRELVENDTVATAALE
ncbi:MAG: hypothetical protein KDE09_03275 [Anaerolineales bacterium]|nr:hypothetical protein [Anaerolineales bacterium]